VDEKGRCEGMLGQKDLNEEHRPFTVLTGRKADQTVVGWGGCGGAGRSSQMVSSDGFIFSVR
jgi:hypothetical protein